MMNGFVKEAKSRIDAANNIKDLTDKYDKLLLFFAYLDDGFKENVEIELINGEIITLSKGSRVAYDHGYNCLILSDTNGNLKSKDWHRTIPLKNIKGFNL
ncbi:hypothetical protein ACSXAC_15410 (plasmid) [Clostridium perfringens]